ncbi:hypothetical protein PFZ49_00830 [Microbacterium lacticum]|uniref:Uncharacterized protein n=1 Tax=Microbacterium lacticum TaxID=33885 RepID=A0A4Y3UM52_9MICO|nr:hypothetical protein [Microbacterium lacticum]TQM91310.1 hypothetical protein FHX68_2522 [Microbacterium lacticum]GEB95746.1 hypothetical protein MLA01_19650 [Microbacterium lacticum]
MKARERRALLWIVIEMNVSESSTTRNRSVLAALGLCVTASATTIAATSPSATTSQRSGK